MKLQILSDLHLEFGPCEVPDQGADLVVLAGDVATGSRGPAWARGAFPARRIVYVPGNHEYYGSSIEGEDERLAGECRALGIDFLQMGVLEVGGVRILGATLWTDMAVFGDATIGALLVKDRMADYHRIRVPPADVLLRPIGTMGLHARMRAWLLGALAQPFSGRTVVVTHHAPSRRSALRGAERDPLTAAFCSAMDDFVTASGAVLWIHGHTHQPVDYVIGGTRVLSNPRGYPQENVVGFEPGMVVEV